MLLDAVAYALVFAIVARVLYALMRKDLRQRAFRPWTAGDVAYAASAILFLGFVGGFGIAHLVQSAIAVLLIATFWNSWEKEKKP